MKNTSISRLLSHMAHVLNTKITTDRSKKITRNDIRDTHILNI
jgi:hypothetical protein